MKFLAIFDEIYIERAITMALYLEVSRKKSYYDGLCNPRLFRTLDRVSKPAHHILGSHFTPSPTREMLLLSQNIHAGREPGEQKAPVNIRNIHSDRELLNLLEAGHSIILYRGFESDHLPEEGQIYDWPAGGTPEEQQDRLKEQLPEQIIEETRRQFFPDCPGRLSSVFAAASPLVASARGTVYEIEISLKSSPPSGYRPVRWLSEKAYVYFSKQGCTAKLARDYLSSHGERLEDSGILIDPKWVQIKVKAKVTSKKIMKDFVDYLFDTCKPKNRGEVTDFYYIVKAEIAYINSLITDKLSLSTVREEIQKRLVALNF